MTEDRSLGINIPDLVGEIEVRVHLVELHV